MHFTMIIAGLDIAAVVLAALGGAGLIALPRFVIWASRAVALFFSGFRATGYRNWK